MYKPRFHVEIGLIESGSEWKHLSCVLSRSNIRSLRILGIARMASVYTMRAFILLIEQLERNY